MSYAVQVTAMPTLAWVATFQEMMTTRPSERTDAQRQFVSYYHGLPADLKFIYQGIWCSHVYPSVSAAKRGMTVLGLLGVPCSDVPLKELLERNDRGEV